MIQFDERAYFSCMGGENHHLVSILGPSDGLFATLEGELICHRLGNCTNEVAATFFLGGGWLGWGYRGSFPLVCCFLRYNIHFTKFI